MTKENIQTRIRILHALKDAFRALDELDRLLDEIHNTIKYNTSKAA